jgi:hypothetical protein
MSAQSLNRNGAIAAVVNVGATAQSYLTGTVIGVPTKIANAVLEKGGTGTLVAKVVLDAAKQSQPMDVYFFSQLPTSQGANGAAFALNATDLQFLLGRIGVLSTDYSVSSAVAEASKNLLSLGVNGGPAKTQGSTILPNSGSRDIFVLAVSRGTYVATLNSLSIKVYIQQD